MSQATIVVVSKNSDFSAVLAEHAASELKLDVQVVAEPEKAKTIKSQLIIADAVLPGIFPAPVLTIKEKPLKLQTLLALIEQNLLNTQDSLALGDCTLSISQKTLSHASGKTASLTDKETQLLAMLYKAGGKGVLRDVLLKDIWSVEMELESHTLETHVYRLRAKLKDVGVTANIIAAPGKYILEV